LAKVLVYSSNSLKRIAALKQASAIWKRWATLPPDAQQEYTWEEFNAKAKQFPLGTEIEYHRWEKKDVIFRFVQDSQGWKVVNIPSTY
jgi:hypothetical protein